MASHHYAKDITPSVTWRREAQEKKEAPDDLFWNHEKESLLVRPTLEMFQRQHWGDISKTRWSASGGGGFFFTCKDFGRMFNNSFPACTFFPFKMEISSCKLIPLFRPGLVHSELIWLTECFLMSCMWARFPIDSHTLPGQWHCWPTPSPVSYTHLTLPTTILV